MFMTRKKGHYLMGLVLLCFLGKYPLAVAEDWVYTVRKGDTLWDLCREYTQVNNCWQLIGPYNDVDFPPNLLPGTRIRIPSKWLRQQPQSVKVTYIKGSAVKILDNGQRSAVVVADELSMGMRLLVDAQSSVALKFADGSTMLVESLSELRFDRLSSYGKTGMVDTRVHLLRGAVQNKVPKKRDDLRFEVSTPSAVAAVRGTEYRVVSDLSEDKSVMRSSVYEGLVAVSNAIEEKQLAKQFGLVAQQDQKLPEAVKLLNAPKLTLDQDSYYLMPFELTWKNLKGAEAYKIELLKQNDNSIAPMSTIAKEKHIVIEGIEQGCYLLRVSGVDAFLLQGMPAKQTICLAKRLDKPVTVSTGGPELNQGKLLWDAVPGAIKYRIDIASSDTFSKVRSLFAETTSIDLEPTRHGDRYIRVTAIDHHNFSGVPSETLKLDKAPANVSGLYVFLTVLAMLVLI